MKNTINKKGFTLVELIIVITILAILATIAFISFQGYSAEARDSKIKAEIGNMRNVIEVEMSKGVSVINYASNSGSQLQVLSLAGTGVATGSLNTYKAGGLNTTMLNSTTTNTYKIGATTLIGGAYQLAGKLGVDNTAYVIGNYNPRATGTGTVGSFRVGDEVVGLNANGYTGTIVAVSTDKSTVTIGSTGSISVSNLSLRASESAGLIAASGATSSGVTNGSTTLLPF